MSAPSPAIQTAIAAGITPTSVYDTFATHFGWYAQGGWKIAADATERLAISAARRLAEMTFVRQGDTGHWWSLEGGVADGNWTDKGDEGPLDANGKLKRSDLAITALTGSSPFTIDMDNGESSRTLPNHLKFELEVTGNVTINITNALAGDSVMLFLENTSGASADVTIQLAGSTTNVIVEAGASVVDLPTDGFYKVRLDYARSKLWVEDSFNHS